MLSTSIQTLNLEEVLQELEDHFSDQDHSVTVSNDSGHARHVHVMQGLSVINPAHFARTVRRALSDLDSLEDSEIVAALEAAGSEEVDWLQSHIGTKDGRPLHPTGWADDTGELHDSYDYDVD